jgi:hypothetical protein
VTARVLALLPAAAVCLAEGAWIAVVAALWLVAAPGGSPSFGVWGLAALVALGLVVARWPRLRATRRAGRVAGVVAVAVGTLAGGASLPGSAVASAGTGALAALAVWRGSRHGDPGGDDVVTSDLLRLGLPGLAIPWLLGAAGSADRAAFIAAALPATLLFVAAALIAVGLTRLEALSAESGLDWASNRAWLFLLGGIVAGLALISVPATLLLGAPVGEVVRGLLAPVVAAVNAVGSVMAAGLTAVGVAPSAAGPSGSASPGPGPNLVVPPWSVIAASAFALFAFLGGVGYVAWRVRGTPRDAPSAARVREERHVELHVPRLSLPSLPRAWRGFARRRPDTVTGAYLAALEHLATRDLGRGGDESPRVHATRVRDPVGWRFGFLAADYELERYGGRRVTPLERRRALARARWLRR